MHNRTMYNRPTGRRGRSATAGLGVVLAALALAGCATAGAADDDGGSAALAAQGMTLSDAWVKAADSGMSAAFGGLTNSGAQDVTVVSVATEASSMQELHETVENETGELVMREIDGGFVIPAGDTLTLEPGGSHIMLMDLTAPLEAGDEVTFTLTFSDDSTFEFTAPVKDYSGANEDYVGGDAGSDAGDTGMDMDSDTDDADGTGTDG